MKLLKWFGIIIAILVVAFLAVGIMTPQFSYDSEVTVNAPAGKAFEVFMNEEKMHEWMPSLQSIETISGAPDEVGSKWKLVFDENGDTVEAVEELTAYEPNKRYAFDIEAEPFLGSVDIHFTPIDSMTTRIHATTTISGKNMAWKSIMAMWKSSMKEQAQEQYELLKKVIEEDHQAASS